MMAGEFTPVAPSRLVMRALKNRLEYRLGFHLDELDKETTREMAEKLEKELDVPPSFWLNAFKLWKERTNDGI